jgi:hypothetical protein
MFRIKRHDIDGVVGVLVPIFNRLYDFFLLVFYLLESLGGQYFVVFLTIIGLWKHGVEVHCARFCCIAVPELFNHFFLPHLMGYLVEDLILNLVRNHKRISITLNCLLDRRMIR